MSAVSHINLFPIGDVETGAAGTDLANNLGMEIHMPDGKKFRLVRFNGAAGLTSVAGRAFMYSSAVAATNLYDVTPVTGTASRCCGVAPTAVTGFDISSQVDLTDNDLFWVQFDGRAEVVQGDDGNTITAGNFVGPSADADTGKVDTTTTTYTNGTTIGRALETTAADGATPLLELDNLKG